MRIIPVLFLWEKESFVRQISYNLVSIHDVQMKVFEKMSFISSGFDLLNQWTRNT